MFLLENLLWFYVWFEDYEWCLKRVFLKSCESEGRRSDFVEKGLQCCFKEILIEKSPQCAPASFSECV